MAYSFSIPDDILDDWHNAINALADMLDVNSVVVSRLNDGAVTFLRGTDGSCIPFNPGDSIDPEGHYCNAVIKSNKAFILPYAPDDPEFCDAPEAQMGLVSYMGFPLRWPDGNMFGILCLLDTKKREYETKEVTLVQQFVYMIENQLALLFSLEESFEANERLSRFCSVVSHDLREPINIVSGHVSLLEQAMANVVCPVEPQMFADIHTSLNQIDQMIGNMLSDARVSGIQTQLQPVNMERLFDTCLTVVSHKTLDEDILVSRGDLPTISGNEGQLIRLLQNLLENSFQYKSLSRGLRVSLFAEDEGDMVRFVLEDNGIGIETENMDRLFNAGFTTDKKRGHGLGLHICRQIVLAHGGTIHAESEKGKGTNISFTLPKHEALSDAPFAAAQAS